MNGETARRIAALNDAHRRALSRCVFGQGLAQLPAQTVAFLLAEVANFDSWDEGKVAHDEHDSGCVEVGEEYFFWRIAYYDAEMRFDSPDPADPSVTCRVLTITRVDGHCPTNLPTLKRLKEVGDRHSCAIAPCRGPNGTVNCRRRFLAPGRPRGRRGGVE